MSTNRFIGFCLNRQIYEKSCFNSIFHEASHLQRVARFFSEQKARLFSFVPRFHCDVLQANSFQSRFSTRSITVTNSG